MGWTPSTEATVLGQSRSVNESTVVPLAYVGLSAVCFTQILLVDVVQVQQYPKNKTDTLTIILNVLKSTNPKGAFGEAFLSNLCHLLFQCCCESAVHSNFLLEPQTEKITSLLIVIDKVVQCIRQIHVPQISSLEGTGWWKQE